MLLHVQMHRCFILGRVLRERTWHVGSSTTHPSCEPAAVPPIYRTCHFRRLCKCVPSVVRQGRPGRPLQRGKQQCGSLQGHETAHFHSICSQSGESLQIKGRMLQERHVIFILVLCLLVKTLERSWSPVYGYL